MTSEKLAAAIRLIKSGDKPFALPLLKEIIQENPNDENAWLWMYTCVEQTEQKRFCLQKVLEINPANQDARKALEKLTDPGSGSVKRAAAPKVPRSAPGPAPRRKGSSRRWIFILGAVLLLILCGIPSIYLAQTGQISAFAAGLPLFPSATPTFTPTLTATATPSPSPTATSTPTWTRTPKPTPTPSEVVNITWFIGLDFGLGMGESQLKAEQQVADDFNASQGFIHLSLQHAGPLSGDGKFTYEIASGIGPDIVGPVDFVQTNSYHGQWLDLLPYVRLADIEPYNPVLVETYDTDEGLVSLPFAVAPAALFYKPELFDKAGLKYPPAHYGEKYEMPDGSQAEWSWDTLAAIARLLTLDSRGRNITQEGFDKTKIAQYGYRWANKPHPSKIGSFWGSGAMLADNGKTAQIPKVWHTAWQWTYDAMWGEQPFMPNWKGIGSTNNAKVVMYIQEGWAMCCTLSEKDWDIAAIPSYNGKVYGRVDVQSFHIWRDTKHPREAYLVMQYLLNTGVKKLLTNEQDPLNPVYSAMPARRDQQQVWIEAQKQRFPQVTNWDVLIAGLDYPDVPHAQSYMPRFQQAWDAGAGGFYARLASLPNLDLAVEEQKYLDELNQLFSFNK